MSQSMLNAFNRAQVGDDVYFDDPTLNSLQDRVAKMFGKEKGLMTLSGTMSNLISILVHCNRGEAAVITQHSHINVYEQGNISSIAGIFPKVIPENQDGTVNFPDVLANMLPGNEHFPKTTLLCMENSVNYLAGKALPLSFNKDLVQFKQSTQIKTHLDGSRLLNAYYFHKLNNKDLKESDITEGFDSVCMCLSKALRCPLGSVLVGSAEFIDKARRWRKALGGGFRQAGYIAAAALQSLDEAEQVLTKDHENAAFVASEFEKKGVEVFKSDTNFLIFKPHLGVPLSEYVGRMKKVGVLANPRIDGRIRFVFHENIKREDAEEVVKRMFGELF